MPSHKSSLDSVTHRIDVFKWKQTNQPACLFKCIFALASTDVIVCKDFMRCQKKISTNVQGGFTHFSNAFVPRLHWSFYSLLAALRIFFWSGAWCSEGVGLNRNHSCFAVEQRSEVDHWHYSSCLQYITKSYIIYQGSQSDKTTKTTISVTAKVMLEKYKGWVQQENC